MSSRELPDKEELERIIGMSQKVISSSINESQESAHYEQFSNLSLKHHQYYNSMALLHSHFASLSYLLDEDAADFSWDQHKEFIHEADIKTILEIGLLSTEKPSTNSFSDIKTILEIGPGHNPMAEAIKNKLDLDAEITYIGNNMNFRSDCRKINSNFPYGLQPDDNFDLIFACGVFSKGGQMSSGMTPFHDATENCEQIANMLSKNKYSIGIIMTKSAASSTIDVQKLASENILLYVNTPQTFYMKDPIYDTLGGTDLIVLNNQTSS